MRLSVDLDQVGRFIRGWRLWDVGSRVGSRVATGTDRHRIPPRRGFSHDGHAAALLNLGRVGRVGRERRSSRDLEWRRRAGRLVEDHLDLSGGVAFDPASITARQAQLIDRAAVLTDP
jgi:hypothetical protein